MCDLAQAWASASNDTELQTRSLCSLGANHLLAGDVQQAIHCVEASLALYTALDHEQTASRELPLAHLLSGAPPTQPLTKRAAEALCWGLLARTQVHAGQVHNSMRSARIARSLAHESKNVWAHITSTLCLTSALLEGGAYEEAFVLMHHTMALARSLPPTILFQRFLTTLGRVYHALQQWEEAQAALAEAAALAATLGLGPARVPGLSQLCMHYALVGQWESAYHYAVQAIALRKSQGVALILEHFCRQYATEGLLRAGEERQARAEVRRLGGRGGCAVRVRLPYRGSVAVRATRDGHSEQ